MDSVPSEGEGLLRMWDQGRLNGDYNIPGHYSITMSFNSDILVIKMYKICFFIKDFKIERIVRLGLYLKSHIFPTFL